MTLLNVLLDAARNLPSFYYIAHHLKGQTMLSLTQKVIAALYKIAEEDNFYVAEQPKLIEKIMDIAELHSDLPEDTFRAIRSRLPNMVPLLEKLGIQFTVGQGDWSMCSLKVIKS